MAGVATPSAAYKMISIPDALDIVLSETEVLPAETVPFQAALHHTLAEDVRAAEPVPGYRASIKVTNRLQAQPPHPLHSPTAATRG
jgi:hypothetical protein